MKMIQVQDLFEVNKGSSYFKNFIEDECGINYITTSGENQGVKTKVRLNPKYKIFPKGTITVALQGSVMSSFVQQEDFYIQTHVAALIEKEPLTIRQKMYYCLCFQANGNRFSFGRKANSAFSTLEIPAPEEIPAWVETIELPQLYIGEAKNNEKVELPPLSEWKEFSFDKLFIIGKAKGPKAKEAEENIGDIPYITATSKNNGIKCLTSIPAHHQGNCLTIGHLGDPFYQEKSFSGNNVTYLYSKTNHMNQYIGLFLVSLMQFLPKKYNYGNVVGIAKMKKEKISLPVDSNGKPDWQLMEDYIKSLPYSKYL